MATMTVGSITKPDTLVTIKIKDDCPYGISWEGKDYYAGQTLSLPAYWAARWIGNGRAQLLEGGETEPGVIDHRDPEPRGRRR